MKHILFAPCWLIALQGVEDGAKIRIRLIILSEFLKSGHLNTLSVGCKPFGLMHLPPYFLNRFYVSIRMYISKETPPTWYAMS